MESQPRIGVYICHCGTNIAATVDVEAVREFAQHLPGVVIARNYTYMCSDPGQGLIKQDCQEQELKRVVVASCSPRMHEPTFRKAAHEGGVNPYRVEMANIREQCSWVHKDRARSDAKSQSTDCLGCGQSDLARAIGRTSRWASRRVPSSSAEAWRGWSPRSTWPTPVSPLTSSNRAITWAGAWPTSTAPSRNWSRSRRGCRQLIERVQAHPNITVYLDAHVAEVEGFVGNFKVRVRQASRKLRACSLNVGAIIVATGYNVFDPQRKPEFGYGQYPQVMTTLELERRLAEGNLIVNGKTPKDIAFVKCVGSRDVQLGNPYCSRVCCMVCAKQARLLREQLPDSRVTVFYMDVRTFGKRGEEFYDEARQAGVLYRRGNVSEIYRKGDRVALRVEDTFLRRVIEHEADLVVLAVGMEHREDAKDVAALLKIPRSADGFFLEAHPKLRPVDTAMDGVFLAGCCQGPKDIPDTVAQAKAAASSALIPLIRGTVPVESATAIVDSELCAGCGLCVDVCPFGAPALDPLWGVSVVNAVLCKGCGTCAAVCPSKAVRLQHFTPEQILAQVDALVW